MHIYIFTCPENLPILTSCLFKNYFYINFFSSIICLLKIYILEILSKIYLLKIYINYWLKTIETNTEIMCLKYMFKAHNINVDVIEFFKQNFICSKFLKSILRNLSEILLKPSYKVFNKLTLIIINMLLNMMYGTEINLHYFNIIFGIHYMQKLCIRNYFKSILLLYNKWIGFLLEYKYVFDCTFELLSLCLNFILMVSMNKTYLLI